MFPAIRQALFAIRRATTSSGIEKKAKKEIYTSLRPEFDLSVSNTHIHMPQSHYPPLKNASPL
jgi:hypothetical protein